MSKTRPKRYTNWFLRDWMSTLEVNQATLIERTDYSKTTISLLVNDQQDYSPTIIRDLALALRISPYELLMHPQDAMQLRKLMGDAAAAAGLRDRLQVVADRTGTEG